MAEPQEKAGEAPAPKKKFPKTLVIVLAVAVVQGGAFFAIFKFMGGHPAPAQAEASHAIETEAPKPAPGVAEVTLVKNFKVPNNKSGRVWLYDVDISIVVAVDQKDKLKQLVEERGGEIGDCIARIMRGATEQILREDDLRILREQVAEGLADITGDKALIQRVLIPRFVPIPS